MGRLDWLKKLFGSTFQLNDDDIAVFVVGPTGSGKSMFVRAVTHASGLVEVGETLEVATKNVQAIRCELTDEARQALGAGERKNIVFVDTPSFHTDAKAHMKAVDETTSWLEKSRSKSPCSCFGTIYLHRIETDPEVDDQYCVQKQLDTFARTFPQEYTTHAFPQRLRCVFSRMDKAKDEKTARHKENFQKQLAELRSKAMSGGRWNTSIHPDFFPVGNDGPDMAWKAVEQLFLVTPPESSAD